MSLYAGMNDQGTGSPVLCDLRSDTVTVPDAAMRHAMISAPLGDDVYGEDASVAELEEMLADMTGKERAVFFPTGTQSNLAAVLSHWQRGDEALVGRSYHIYCDEAAGVSVLGGVAMSPLDVDAGGAILPAAIERGIHDDDPHYPATRLLCLENSVSGKVISPDRLRSTAGLGRSKGLAVHLDGARLFNAAVWSSCLIRAFADPVDTVSLCMSKGIGAPAGTVLAGPADLMAKARRLRSARPAGYRNDPGSGSPARRTLCRDVDRSELGACLSPKQHGVSDATARPSLDAAGSSETKRRADRRSGARDAHDISPLCHRSRTGRSTTGL